MATEFTIASLPLDQINYAEIERVWNAAYPAEFLFSQKLWLQNTVNDPAFRPTDLLIVLMPDGSYGGFALLKHYRKNTPGLEKYWREGFIAAFAIAPEYQRQKVGSYLLGLAEATLQQENIKRINLGGNLRHFFPGLPVQCQAARAFFEHSGYTFADSQPQVDLDGALLPELFAPTLAKVRGLTYRQGRTDLGDEQGWLTFLDEAFPGRWRYEAELYLAQGGALEEVTFALDSAGKIVGFLFTNQPSSRLIQPGRYWLQDDSKNEWGSIGPLGIHPQIRGGGGGLGLVASGMQHLYEQGLKYARIDWTDLVSFYGKLGFQPVLTYLEGSTNL